MSLCVTARRSSTVACSSACSAAKEKLVSISSSELVVEALTWRSFVQCF
jgi:hypothetical protein